jgi:hypothetical protein
LSVEVTKEVRAIFRFSGEIDLRRGGEVVEEEAMEITEKLQFFR